MSFFSSAEHTMENTVAVGVKNTYISHCVISINRWFDGMPSNHKKAFYGGDYSNQREFCLQYAKSDKFNVELLHYRFREREIFYTIRRSSNI